MNRSQTSFSLVIALLFSISAIAAPTAKKTTATKTDAAANASPTPAGVTLPIQDGTIAFYAIGKPSMLKIHGESTKMSGSMLRDGGNLSGKLEIPLESFETGMSVRNNHLKEKVFETTKYDKAVLTISSLVLPSGKTGEIKDLPFTGKLNLHGVDKDISGTATVNAGDKSVSFTADFQIKMSDFSIAPPEFMGMSMQDDVKVTAKGEAKSSI